MKSFNQFLLETLTANASAKDWIDDFVNSTNPKFEGKSKEERTKMALAAFYAKRGQVDESKVSADYLHGYNNARQKSDTPKSQRMTEDFWKGFRDAKSDIGLINNKLNVKSKI